MGRLITIFVSGLLVSAYLFPVEFMFLRGMNTKMMLALSGIALLVLDMLQGRSIRIEVGHIRLFFCALAVSLTALLSITVNQTPDTTYVSYIASFFVWFSAAYSVCWLLKRINGKLTLDLLADYLVGVCVFQCVAAIVIDSSPQLAAFVDTWVFQDQALLHNVKRLYGLGASLDSGGVRFSVVMGLMSFCLCQSRMTPLRMRLYILSFFILVVIGSMISRTTLVGILIALLYGLLFSLFGNKPVEKNGERALLPEFLTIIVPLVLLCFFLYNADGKARSLFEFAFEGFFSLFENGKWEVGSNEILKSMVVFPDSLHTWIIGDGYFNNSKYDVYYLGDATEAGYYMGTDIGYLRFLFYFGTIGLFCMMAVIVRSMLLSMDLFPSHKALFVIFFLVGLIIWMKVATDVFFIYALFICVASIEGDSASNYAQG